MNMNTKETLPMARSTAPLLVASLAAAWIAGCAGEVVDVDRTSPNKIQKSLFEGEWYFNPTVVETEFNQGLLFEGLMGGADRIRWDIREDVLVANRSYATLENAEEGSTESTDFQGTTVAMFPIESHFDVIRDYNSATGEESNVIVENTTDRPWFERDYIRVDWSQNLVATSYNLSGIISAISAAPYYVQEHEIDNPYRAEIGPRNINVVGNYILEPDASVCFGALQDGWCGASTAKMKLSFKKVPGDGGVVYEPLQYPDGRVITDGTGNVIKDCDSDNDGVFDGDCQERTVPMFERFGFFRTERRRYDDDALWTRDGRVFLANRWNIWERSKNAAGTTIPFENRTVRKITYHTNVDFPVDQELYRMNDELVAEWDGAFRETVAQLRTLGGINTDPADVETVFEWKRNSCNVDAVNVYADNNDLEGRLAEYGISTVTRANLKRACAVLEFYSDGDFTWEKVGDLRHSYLHWVDTPQQAGPLGYGPTATDPITGEIIAGYSNVYGASIDTYAAYAADIATLLDGSLDDLDFAQGTVSREQLRSRGGFGDQFAVSGVSYSGTYAADKMSAMRGRFEGFKDQIRARDPLLAQRFQRELGDALREKMAVAQNRDLLDLARAQGDVKLDRLAGSRFEKEILLTDQIKRAIHGPEWQQGEGEYVSPLKWLKQLQQRDAQREEVVGRASIMMADWADEGVLWLADELQGLSWDEVYARARQQIYRAVQTHEVGHTVGLRHNFEGSWDALNFHDEFWENYNPSTERVERVDSAGNPTDAERYMYSSIMDYMPRPFDDWAGLGKYDRAAIAFGYGQLVEIWNPEAAAFSFDDLRFLNDYGKIPRFLAGDMSCLTGRGDCQPDMEVALTTNSGTEFNRALNSYLFNAASYGSRPANADEAIARINSRQYVKFEDLYRVYEEFYRSVNSDLLFTFKEVDYRFCPDERVFPNNEECQRWDKGANYREIIADRWERYDKYYWFNNYKRDRAGFNDNGYINGYINRVFARHLGPMSSMYQNYLFGDFLTIGETLDGDFLTLNDFDTGMDWQAAALDGLNYLSSVINSPEPGAYCLDATSDVYQPMVEGQTCSTTEIEIPLGVGRRLLTEWTDEYYFKATVIGTFWDKWIALTAMTDNSGLFFQNLSDLLDSGSFSLSYWRGLPDEMLSFFQSAYLGEAGEAAWRFDPGLTGDARFRPSPVADIYEDSSDVALARIQPSTSWTLRYFAMSLSMAKFNSVYDYTEDFAYYARVCLEGSSDCLIYDAPVERYTDPISYYQYVAPLLGNEEGQDIGASILREAQSYADTVYAPVKQLYDEMVASPDTFTYTAEEQVRIDGGATRDEIRLQREIELSRAKRGVNERTSFVDIMRDISERTEFGQ